MDETDEPNAVLVGGPSNGQPISLADDIAVLEVQTGAEVHRYIRTTGHRSVEGRSLLVYNYDGELYDNPERTPEGAETRHG